MMETFTTVHIDEIDRRILEILQEEGRISTLELAARIGLSPTPCARRVKRLEERGVIERYVALLSPSRLGVTLDAFVNVSLRHNTVRGAEHFEKEMTELPEVVECYMVTGEHDYLLHLRVANAAALKDFLREKLSATGTVGRTDSCIVIDQKKRTTALPIPETL